MACRQIISNYVTDEYGQFVTRIMDELYRDYMYKRIVLQITSQEPLIGDSMTGGERLTNCRSVPNLGV